MIQRLLPGLFWFLTLLLLQHCWAHPVITGLNESSAEDLDPLVVLLAAAGSNSSNSIPIWKVHQITSFSLDGNAADFLAQTGIGDNNDPILAQDSSLDNTGGQGTGTDIVQVWMGHDGTNFVFWYQTLGLPPDSGSCSSGGCYYQLNIAGWLINVNNNSGTAQRIGARDFFGSTGGCVALTSAEVALVNNSPAGFYGFEVRVNPACLEVGSSGSIDTYDRSVHTLDVTADFYTIFWDRMDIAQKTVTWDFSSY
ncbi:MAG: hypothetical protein KDK39_08350 [Leptospiraceae bacterium]|nr:hypothetical protein [Leptospiraceae bacterium]